MQKPKTQDSPHPVQLGLAEAGKLLGYSYPTMLQLANRDDFPAFKCMGKWIVPYQQLLDWLEEQARGGE